MYNLDVCLDTHFKDRPLPGRVAPVARAGYTHIETWQSQPEVLNELKKACDDNSMSLVCVVVNAPNGAETALVTPETHDAFLQQLDRVSDDALQAGCAMGIVCTGNAVPDTDITKQKEAVISVLHKARDLVVPKKFRLVLEALNTRVDHAGYFLDDPDVGFDIIRAVDSPNVRLLYDIYHMGIQERDIQKDIKKNIGLIGHFHAAGVPGRKEVTSGDLDYRPIMDVIRETGYRGCVGLEYFPSGSSDESLKESYAYLNTSHTGVRQK